MAGKVQYVVVENAGYDGERVVAKFGTRWAAEGWVGRTYSATEIDELHVDVGMEEDGRRTYDPHGFDQ